MEPPLDVETVMKDATLYNVILNGTSAMLFYDTQKVFDGNWTVGIQRPRKAFTLVYKGDSLPDALAAFVAYERQE